MAFRAHLGGFLKAAVDLVLPPRCLGTRAVVQEQGMLNPDFWREVQFIERPFCDRCGLPFGFEAEGPTLCGACLEHDPVFDAARAAVIYNDASRKLILAFKHGDQLHAVKTFTPWMLRAGEDFLPGADMIVPVPLHPARLRERRFNQSALLAAEIARHIGKIYVPDALARTRATPPMKGMTRRERQDNVAGAFAVSGKDKVAGKNIILIDDVFTTGATLNACARVLKAAGTARVDILTIARVTKEEL